MPHDSRRQRRTHQSIHKQEGLLERTSKQIQTPETNLHSLASRRTKKTRERRKSHRPRKNKIGQTPQQHTGTDKHGPEKMDPMVSESKKVR
jgi:hypothetical protein